MLLQAYGPQTTKGNGMKTTHTPDTLTQASLAEMAPLKGRPCLSLYQPTHRHHPENQQDQIRFRHLVKGLETSLRPHPAGDAVKALLEPFEALAQDHDFRNHTEDGLAVLSAPGLFRVFLLQRPVAELAVVADSLHTKPLRQWLQSTGRYQVLALSLNKVQGDRKALNAVALKDGVPQTTIDPQGLTQDILRQRAWKVVAPQLEAEQTAWSDAYAVAAAKATGRIDPSELGNPRACHVLDDLGALAECMGGEVHVLPAERMPCRTGVAASFSH